MGEGNDIIFDGFWQLDGLTESKLFRDGLIGIGFDECGVSS